MLQAYNLFPQLTALQNLDLGIHPSLKLGTEEKASVETVAALFELKGLLHRLPSSLSGGERQRVALRRALLRKKPILLLDSRFALSIG